jgi:hypothetical protein
MKRKIKFIVPRRFDRNVELAYIAGQRARLEDKPATRCPNLIPQYGESYAVKLMDAWMRGWSDRDVEQRSPKLALAPPVIRREP